MSLWDLISAAGMGDISRVKILLSEGVPVDNDDIWRTSEAVGSTNYKSIALMNAVSFGHLDVIQLLLENNASIDFVDKFGLTVLMRAVLTRDPKIVQGILQSGLKRESIDPHFNLQSYILRRNKQGMTAYELSHHDNIKRLIVGYLNVKTNMKKLENFQTDYSTYFSVIPKDLITLIGNELRNVY